MNEIHQRRIFDYLVQNKIENFIGVPDSTMKYFIDQGFKRKKVLITTREEEAIGIASGLLYLKAIRWFLCKMQDLQIQLAQ